MFSNDAINRLKKKSQSLESPKNDVFGKVMQVVGNIVEASLPEAPLGAKVKILGKTFSQELEGEVVGFRKNHVLIIPYQDPTGICHQAVVKCVSKSQKIAVGDHLIGRVVDANLNPLDDKGEFGNLDGNWAVNRKPLNPLNRRRIKRVFDMGVKSINGILTCGEGQRLGIFAGSGVGKSVLLGMISRYAEAHLNVIALVGERGREVLEFVEENLGKEGLARSIVVVSTGDESPLARIKAAQVATAIAEYYRDVQEKKVLLMMDSLTRVAMAQREIGLAVGEPPTTKGYTPSVFTLLPRLLERTGNARGEGSITAIYTVLVDGDDINEPIADATRGILDGHMVLSRDLAAAGHYPAIDVLQSASRVLQDICSQEHEMQIRLIRKMISLYQKNEDLLSIGAYVPGANIELDVAVNFHQDITAFLTQTKHESFHTEACLQALSLLYQKINSTIATKQLERSQ